MINKLITIGSASNCDFIINRSAYPTMYDYIIDRISPIHAQIIQVDENYYLLPFSDYIFINGMGITSLSFEIMKDKGEIVMENGFVVLKDEDRVSFGIDIFWQQWMAGLGLRCDKCKYWKHRLHDDEWCRYCMETHRNPPPMIYGYSWKFEYGSQYCSGFYNYSSCEKCNGKPFHCVECDSFLKVEPKNKSFKEHVDMYIQRLNTYDEYLK